jgi:hypothetical protein
VRREICEIFRFDRQGRILVEEMYEDALSVMRQLGAAPATHADLSPGIHTPHPGSAEPVLVRAIGGVEAVPTRRPRQPRLRWCLPLSRLPPGCNERYHVARGSE